MLPPANATLPESGNPPPYASPAPGTPLFTMFCNSWLHCVACKSGAVPFAFCIWLRSRVQGHVLAGGKFPDESTNWYLTLSTLPSPSTSPSKVMLVLETETSPTAIVRSEKCALQFVPVLNIRQLG